LKKNNSKLLGLLALVAALLVAAIFIFFHGKQLPEHEALQIAQNYIGQHYDWAGAAKYNIKRENGFWEVTITAPHNLPNGTQILSVEVNDKGQITAFM
jgi:hypothetical protein